MIGRKFKLIKWNSSLPEKWKSLKTPNDKMDIIVELCSERNGKYYYHQEPSGYPLLERNEVEMNKEHWEEVKIENKYYI